MQIYLPRYLSYIHIFTMFIFCSGWFIHRALNFDWEDLQCIVIRNQFKQSGQLAIYFSHWTCPIAGDLCLDITCIVFTTP